MGDTPYVIDVLDYDRYPLMQSPVTPPSSSAKVSVPPELSALVAVAVVAIVAVAAAVLAIRRRRRGKAGNAKFLNGSVAACVLMFLEVINHTYRGNIRIKK